MQKPTLHLICTAHLDPVWQWRWEEGCSEALSTFGNAVELLRDHKDLIFNHNEAVLYRWVQKYDPALFKAIRRLAKQGRWCISGGWYLQPDLNLPGTESLIRQIAEGRRFFEHYFDARPVVAYNFDSFGHGGGLPQILVLAGYKMYIHMRPQENEMHLPSDLYRWRGVDGTEILTYRIAVGLYHTERDNIAQRLQEGTELALKRGRDVPVFWGIGNHGGGATREDLEIIDAFSRKEDRVRVRHSTPEKLYSSLRTCAKHAPVVDGDLQRVFTGCYTSLSRIKRQAQRNLGEIVQAEMACTAAWLNGHSYPSAELEDIWRDHMFNDFHDVLPGSCTEPAERDALEIYGRSLQTARALKLSAASSFNQGKPRKLYVPVTVLHTNTGGATLPIEVECMLDLRPKWTGSWHLRLFTLDGTEIPCQEEQPESLLPFNGWRRKVVFLAGPLEVGVRNYELRIAEGKREAREHPPAVTHSIDSRSGFINSLDAGDGRECLAGPLLRPLVVNDEGDAWGTGLWSYRDVVGEFQPVKPPTVLHEGAVRRVTETVLGYGGSGIVMQTIAYNEWPVMEFRLRIQWNERHRRLKLSVPTVFRTGRVLCEVPGGAIFRPADGEEHVHGRWCFLQDTVGGKETGFAVINSGQPGFDFKDGELRFSVLRSAAYCHEQGLAISGIPQPKYMDQGVHDVRLLVIAGDAITVRDAIPGLADWLSAPPAVYSHLPIGGDPGSGRGRRSGSMAPVVSLDPPTVRLTACKQSWDGKAVIVRCQETMGMITRAAIRSRLVPKAISLTLAPFQLKTIRIGRNGKWREVRLIEEQ